MNNDTAIRTITKRKNQYSLTIPIKMAEAMNLQDKEQIFVQYDAKSRTISLNKIGKVE